jgi:DNA-binding XRE family transcriptional regulator
VPLNRHALRTIRERSGLTVSALARAAGVSQPHLSNIEQGRRQASPQVISRLAGALKVPIVALLADVDDDPEPAPPPGRRRSLAIVHPSLTTPVPAPGATMTNPSLATAPGMAPAQVSRPPVGPASAPKTSRRVVRATVGLAAAGAVLGSVAPAHAEVYYSSQCSVSQLQNNEYYYRTFQARIVGSIEDGTGKYVWDHYDYRYSVDIHLQAGASSDEVVSFKSGYSDGLSNPWHSPDSHGTSGDWITEGGWKGAKSYWGYTKVNFYAAFDIPKYADPHCNATTAQV